MNFAQALAKLFCELAEPQVDPPCAHTDETLEFVDYSSWVNGVYRQQGIYHQKFRQVFRVVKKYVNNFEDFILVSCILCQFF